MSQEWQEQPNQEVKKPSDRTPDVVLEAMLAVPVTDSLEGNANRQRLSLRHIYHIVRDRFSRKPSPQPFYPRTFGSLEEYYDAMRPVLGDAEDYSNEGDTTHPQRRPE